MSRKKMAQQRNGYEIVDDSLRDAPRAHHSGRVLRPLTQDLLDGLTCRVAAGTILPDKTLKSRGLRLHYYTDDDGSVVVWGEPL